MGDHKGFVLPAAAAPVGAGDDGVGDGMLCVDHPQYNHRRANPGGICPICLQEKLGRLVSSSDNKASPHLFSPSALAAPPYSYSPSSPSSSSLRATAVMEATAVTGYGRAASGGRANYSSPYDAGTRHRSSLGNRTGSGGKSRMLPFLSDTHSKIKKGASGCSGSSTTTRTSSAACSRKVISSTTSSSSLSAISTTTSSSSGSNGGNQVFKRSKSVAPRPSGGTDAIMEDPETFDSPRKKSFWSFLYLSSYQQHNQHHHHSLSSPRSTTATTHVRSGVAKRRGAEGGGGSKDASSNTTTTSATAAATTPYIRDIKLLPQPPQLPAISTVASCSSNKPQENPKTPRREYPPATAGGTSGAGNAASAAAATTAARGEETDDSPGSGSQASASFGRKVARSRSVGCGSRSFSGDFLERISTGFGDCTLRRVESQREAKLPAAGKIVIHHSRRLGEDPQELPPQRVRCGGMFGGFYSSSSSSYWLSEDLGSGNSGTSGRISTASAAGEGSGDGDSGTPHARRSWVWAFASPMRAFRGSSSSSNKHGAIVSINGAVTGTGRSASASTVGVGEGTSTAAAPPGATATGTAALLDVKG